MPSNVLFVHTTRFLKCGHSKSTPDPSGPKNAIGYFALCELLLLLVVYTVNTHACDKVSFFCSYCLSLYKFWKTYVYTYYTRYLCAAKQYRLQTKNNYSGFLVRAVVCFFFVVIFSLFLRFWIQTMHFFPTNPIAIGLPIVVVVPTGVRVPIINIRRIRHKQHTCNII